MVPALLYMETAVFHKPARCWRLRHPPAHHATPIPADDLAGTSHLRRRRPRLIIRPDEATDYWERNLLYEDDGAEVGCGALG